MFTEIMDDNSETELRDEDGHYRAGVEHVDKSQGMDQRSDIELGSIAVKRTWEIQEETIGNQSQLSRDPSWEESIIAAPPMAVQRQLARDEAGIP